MPEMRAAWYEKAGAPKEVLVVGDLPIPEPGPGQVRVRIYVSCVNPGDAKKRSGAFGPPAFARIIPHSDGAGAIDAVGEGVAKSRVGQRVWVYNAQSGRPFGTAADFCVLPQAQAVRLPDQVDFETGACLGIAARTAHRLVLSDGPVTGRTVLVAGGAGSVGQFAIQLAKRGGATVFATVGAGDQKEIARAAGARHVFNYKEEDVAARVADLTARRGADRIVEVAFGSNIKLDVALLKLGGTIAAYSSDADPEPHIPFWDLVFKGATVRFVGVDSVPEQQEAAIPDITSALHAGLLRPRVSHRFKLEQIAEAHELVDAGKTGGRVLIVL